jgi:hypothetical protein
MQQSTRRAWLMLIHQIPPKPDYFRVKIWRRLQQIGAVAVKQSVYVLPHNEEAYEDFSWLLKEIVEGGGEAFVGEVDFLEGLPDDRVIALFQEARRADYEKVIEEARLLLAGLDEAGAGTVVSIGDAEGQHARLQKRAQEIFAIDFFPAPQRGVAEVLLAGIADKLKGAKSGREAAGKAIEEVKGRTWVTRANVFVDRMACAWLIRRFIDADARLKFVGSKKYTPRPGELRFDMFDAEYTHDGDLCSFEVMIERFGLDRRALTPIAEMVHDIDLKDEKFNRPETAGLAALISGIAMACARDEERIERGGRIFDDFLEFFRRQAAP